LINRDQKLAPAAISRLDQPTPVKSVEFPLVFCLNPANPSLDVIRPDGELIQAIPISKASLNNS
jgi:hypothetical protein